MVHGSEYVAMPSRASAALSPIGLCRVVLRVGSRAGTVTIKIQSCVLHGKFQYLTSPQSN